MNSVVSSSFPVWLLKYLLWIPQRFQCYVSSCNLTVAVRDVCLASVQDSHDHVHTSQHHSKTSLFKTNRANNTPPPTCQFDGDTEVKYVLILLLRLWRPRLYNTHGVLVSSLCWHNYQRVAPSLKHAGPWNGPGCLEGDLGSRLTVVFLHSNRVA